MPATPDALQPGQQILHYRLTEKLGEGGMGVVWMATDTTLDRPVALKALPPAFAADPERLARFEREARLLASLNHPNIATVYSVHVVEGVRYLGMELVPGEDLAQRIARGPVPVPESLEIARQVALALEAAHEHGVIHRDLKPANIRITPDGRVKVLDFGLAKAAESGPASGTLSQSPTFAVSGVTSGMIIGTAAYMAPEQARGQPVDRRADIWAFGVVFYEMLTGVRAFTGETVSDTLAAVLRAEPDRGLLPKDLPPFVRAMLDRCLEKSAKRRLRDIGEALLVLEDAIAGKDPAPAVAAPSAAGPARRAAWWPLAVAAVALTVAAAALLRPGPPPPPLRKLTLSLQSTGTEIHDPAISPDGRSIAYIQSGQLWMRDLTLLTSRQLASGLDEDFRPVWSPDGKFIAFATSNGLARVSVAGGGVTPVCSASEFTGGSGGSWTEDGRILFARGQDHIYTVAAGGGVPAVLVARIDSLEGDLHHPLAFPGKRPIACIVHSLVSGPNSIALVEPGKRKTLLTIEGGFLWDLAYDPRGYLVYGRLAEGAGIWALPFSPERMEATGEPFLIAPEGSSPSVSAGGALVYRLGSSTGEARAVRLDRSGAVLDTLGRSHRGQWTIAPSRDGRFLAVEIRETAEGDVWLFDLARGSESRFAFGTGRQGEPAWSPDGREILYREFSTGMVMAKPADGSREARPIVRGFQAEYAPDGKHLFYCREGVEGSPDIWYRSLDGSSDSLALVATAASELAPAAAPAGGYFAYVSDESGTPEVFLKSYPGGEGRWQVSANGGTRPVWNATGDRLYYATSEMIYEVEVQLSPTVRLSNPKLLFDTPRLGLQNFGRHFLVPTAHPDRFIGLKLDLGAAKSPTDVVFVENWPAEFAKQK